MVRVKRPFSVYHSLMNTFTLVTAVDKRPLHTHFYAHKPDFHHWFDEMMRWRKNGRCFWLVCWQDGDLIANGQLLIYPHGAEYANLAVVPARQGQGIGTAMIAALDEIARENGLAEVEIGVDVENGRALALYERLGFVEDRRIRLMGGKTAVVLCKMLAI